MNIKQELLIEIIKHKGNCGDFDVAYVFTSDSKFSCSKDCLIFDNCTGGVPHKILYEYAVQKYIKLFDKEDLLELLI